MRHAVAATVLVLAAAGGCTGPKSPDPQCGPLLCGGAQRLSAARALGLADLSARGLAGEAYLAVGVDPDGKVLPAVLFARSARTGAERVEIRRARSGDGPAVLAAPLPDAAWNAVAQAYGEIGPQRRRAGFGRRLAHPFGHARPLCMDGVSYALSTSVPGQPAREWGRGCGDAGSAAADAMARIAARAFPQCRAAPASAYAFQDLQSCFRRPG